MVYFNIIDIIRSFLNNSTQLRNLPYLKPRSNSLQNKIFADCTFF